MKICFVVLTLCGAAIASTDKPDSVSLDDLEGKGMQSMENLVGSVIEDLPPMGVSEYKRVMTRNTDKVLGIMANVSRFGAAARKTLYNPTEKDMEALGEHYDRMTDNVAKGMDRIALELVSVAFRLYEHAEGFKETNFCDDYKNFDFEYDSEDPTPYLAKMGDVFLKDLDCFLGLSSHIQELKEKINQEGEMAEDEAASMTFGFLQGLHVFRLNAFRFKDAVDAAIEKMSNGDDEQNDQELRTLRTLRNLLRKRMH